MDVSDGLVKDLERMSKASGVGAEINSDLLQFSKAAGSVLSWYPEDFCKIVAAGDDYEILAAVSPGEREAFRSKVQKIPVGMHRIGTFVEGAGVVVKRIDGSVITFDRTGWDHF